MTISLETEGTRVKHNDYVLEDYYSRDIAKGLIIDQDGRAARVNEAFIIAIHQSFEQTLGATAGSLVFYNVGKKWGEKHFGDFSDRMRREYGDNKKDVQSMNMQFVFEKWWWPFTVGGFGDWSLDLRHRTKDVTILEIKNSVVAQSLKTDLKPVCHLYAGLFAGAMAVYDKDERAAIELECYAMGSDCCKFIIGNDDKVSAAEFWKNEGATVSDILSLIN